MKRLLLILSAFLLLMTQNLSAESKDVLNLQVRDTVVAFEHQVKGARDFLERIPGYLVVPNLYKAGFMVGGEYGEGALVVGGKITDYYRVMGASFGLQIGAQKRSMIVAFLTPNALQKFRRANRWKAGVDGSVAVVDWGKTVDLSTIDLKKSIVAFVFNNKGLMANLTVDGTIFVKIRK